MTEKPTNQPEPTREFYASSLTTAWLQVVGGFCLNLQTWGLTSAYGVFQTHYSLELLPSSSDSSVAWIGSIQAFLLFAVSFLIGPIFDAGHLHSLLLVGSALILLGFFTISLSTEYWQFLLCQGIAMGLGFGCVYLPGVALVSQHFRRHRALAISIASSGAGVGGVVFPLAFTQLEPRIGFAWATRILAFITLVSCVISLTVMRFPDASPSATSANPGQTTAEPRSHSKPKLMARLLRKLFDPIALRDVPFAVLVLGLASGFMGIYTMLYYVNLLAIQRTNASRSIATSTLEILNAASAIGRILPSVAADRIGPNIVISLASLCSVILAFSALAVRDIVPLVVWAVLFGAAAGAFQGLPAACIVSVSSSSDNIGARLGMTLGMVGCGVLVAEPIAGAILASKGGWSGLIGWSGALLTVSCCLTAVSHVLRFGFRLSREEPGQSN